MGFLNKICWYIRNGNHLIRCIFSHMSFRVLSWQSVRFNSDLKIVVQVFSDYSIDTMNQCYGWSSEDMSTDSLCNSRVGQWKIAIFRRKCDIRFMNLVFAKEYKDNVKVKMRKEKKPQKSLRQQHKQKIIVVISYQLCNKLRSQISLVNASYWAADLYKAFRCSVLYKIF